MAMHCRFLIFSAVITQLACSAIQVSAQTTVSSFASTQLRNIQSRNSAANYSISRINSQAINEGIPSAGVAGVNLQNFARRTVATPPRQPLVGNTGMAGSKPFSRLDRGPTVSPYLALNNPFSTAEDYYNIVRPLQDQRRTNDAVAKQQYMQARRLNQIAAQGPYSITGNPEAAPTGHSSGFMRLGAYMNTGNYFAPPTQAKSSR